jgi:hypothetical protein
VLLNHTYLGMEDAAAATSLGRAVHMHRLVYTRCYKRVTNLLPGESLLRTWKPFRYMMRTSRDENTKWLQQARRGGVGTRLLTSLRTHRTVVTFCDTNCCHFVACWLHRVETFETCENPFSNSQHALLVTSFASSLASGYLGSRYCIL